MGLIPDEGKDLPPPGLINRNSVWVGGMGWGAAMLTNGLNNRPPLKSGVPRQVIYVAIGWFLGYQLTKYENYYYAKRDRDVSEYIRLHPEEFPPKQKKTFAEIVEPFHPVR